MGWRIIRPLEEWGAGKYPRGGGQKIWNFFFVFPLIFGNRFSGYGPDGGWVCGYLCTGALGRHEVANIFVTSYYSIWN